MDIGYSPWSTQLYTLEDFFLSLRFEMKKNKKKTSKFSFNGHTKKNDTSKAFKI